MHMTPFSFTYEYLSGLKFKELQKLSVQFHVYKRWAKKQELIENLLALKENNETTIEKNQEEEQEWRDATTVFSDLNFKKENEGNKRLTYNVITKSSAEHIDSHQTFEVPQNGKNSFLEIAISRETYDIPPSQVDFNIEPVKVSRATFEVQSDKKLIDNADITDTFDMCKKEEKLMEESMTSEFKNLEKKTLNKINRKNSEINMKVIDSFLLKQDVGKIKKFDINSKEKDERKKPVIKLLTIPHARVTKRTKTGESSKNDSSPIKMSRKSINIKKSTLFPVSKIDLIKSPEFNSVKKSLNRQTKIPSITKNQPQKIVQSKVPIGLQFTEKKSKLINDCNKENFKKILRKQLSKTTDQANKQSNVANINLRTSLSSAAKTSLKKACLRKDTDGRMVQTPDKKVITKPIMATKMPDFNKIHQRQFEQMDSLHDYLKKKEDRIRKLFGTPQPGQKLHVNLNKSATVFHFQSTTERENNEAENLKLLPVTPVKKKENDSKFTQKETFKSKLRTDIKHKNRSHIHGVRTNKRFELQMKFRNM